MAREQEDYTEPRAMEVESARLLANEHREELRSAGYNDEQIRKLADEYVANTEAEPGGFLEWVRQRRARDEIPGG